MLTARDNFMQFFNGGDYEWVPNSGDVLSFRPAFIPCHIARGLVMQQQPYTGELGGADIFGVNWVFDPTVGGSMEKAPLFGSCDDLSCWREYLKFPDLDNWDWERCSKENADFLKTDKLIQTTIYTGFFERLISFIGFENAAIAMVDEDQEDDIREIFSRLADFYADLIIRMKKSFNVEFVELHDDWGSQISTLISKDTHTRLILPYVKRFAEAVGRAGILVEQHSCGKIDNLIPNMIESGVATWAGQAVCDKEALVAKYGDKFHFAIYIRPEAPVSDEEAIALIDEAMDKYQNNDVWIVARKPFSPAQQRLISAYIKNRGRG